MFGVVLLVTFIMPVIYPLFIAVLVVSYVCVWVAEWQLVCIVELISTGDGQIMETLDSIGIKLCVGCTERTLVVFFIHLFVLCSTSFGAFQIVFSNSLYDSNAKCETSHIFKQDRLLVHFSWSICNQNGHFIRCIQTSSFQGYDDIHKSWEDIIS